MYPHERSLVKELADEPFVLIGVNSDEDREAIQKTTQEEGITWRSFWNGGSTRGPISTRWNVRGWPTIYVIDAEGKIRHKNLRGDDLENAIKALVAEAKGAGEGAGHGGGDPRD